MPGNVCGVEPTDRSDSSQVSDLRVLVSVPAFDGDAGVLLDAAGDVWLSARVDRLSGPQLADHQPAHVGLDEDRTLVGGRLPSGAVGAEVIDDAGRRIRAISGDGVWAAILDQPISWPEPPRWCWDATGAPVAPELPADWPRVRVTDADEPCPACGHTVWDQVTPTDDSRGMRGTREAPSTPLSDDHYAGMEPTPFVVCTACGYEESIGAIMRFASHSDEEAAANKRRDRDALRDHERDKRGVGTGQVPGLRQPGRARGDDRMGRPATSSNACSGRLADCRPSAQTPG